jgi:predicted ATPase
VTIRSIRAKNIRSFKDLYVEFAPLTVVVGANASGKSNLVQIFRFLRDLVDNGVEDAVSLQGGAEFLRNARAQAEDLIEIEVSSDHQASAPFALNETTLIHKSTYSFAVDAGQDGASATIPKEELVFDLGWREAFSPAPCNGQIRIRKGKLAYEITSSAGDSPVLLKISQQLRPFLNIPFESDSLPHKVLLSSVLSKSFAIPVISAISRIAVFDVNPKEPKVATIIGGKAQLEPDANNLAFVLSRLLRNPDTKQSLLNILQDVLPFVTDITTERYSDGTIYFGIAESHTPEFRFPAQLLSDGTVNLLAIIVALFFDRRGVVAIEEPERNVHPALISKLMAMIEDASRQKQIILTTHSPEIVRHLRPENLVLLYKDAEGFSQVERPADDEAVQHFLADEIGLSDLFVQDLLSPNR